MARQFTIGFETNSLTNGVEANTFTTLNNGGLSIQTGTTRTGTYALKVNPPSSAGGDNVQLQFSSSHAQYFRVYINFSAFPTTVDNSFLLVADSTNGVVLAYLAIETNGTISLSYGDTSGGNTLVGTSSVLLLNTWYMAELYVNDTGGTSSTITEARLNKAVFATRTGQVVIAGNGGLPNGFVQLGDQLLGTNTTGSWYIDDYAINDGTGSSQNTYPGPGSIYRLNPNAAGDSNAFGTQIGGTAGASNNYTRVNETTPNDLTSYNADTTNGNNDEFNIDNTPSTIAPSDVISVVHQYVRYAGLGASANATFRPRIKKLANGTVLQGTAITPASTAFTSVYGITSYTDPDGNPWTKATLDTTQIGNGVTATGTNGAAITSTFLIVETTPEAGRFSSLSRNLRVGDGMSRSEGAT